MAVRPMSQMGQKRRSPPHSITARHTGSHGKHRNRVTTWSYTSTELPDGQISDLPVQPPLQKIFRFPRRANHLYKLGPSRPTEGRLAIVTDAGRDAVDADALLTNGAEADGEVVWS